MSYDVDLVVWSGPQAEAHVFWREFSSGLPVELRQVDVAELHLEPRTDVASRRRRRVSLDLLDRRLQHGRSHSSIRRTGGAASTGGWSICARSMRRAESHQFAKVEVSW